METRILSSNCGDGDLVGAVQAIAAFLKVDCTIETKVILSTESKKLIEMVDVLTGCNQATKPIEVSVQPAETKELKFCEICGTGFIPRRKDQKLCSDPKCKKGYQAKYKAGHLTRKQIKSVVPVAEVSPDPAPLASQSGLE